MQNVFIVFFLLCFFSFIGCSQKKSISNHHTAAIEQSLDQTGSIDLMPAENIYTSEKISDPNEIQLTQLLGVPLPIGFKLHKNLPTCMAEISAQLSYSPFDYQQQNKTLLFPFSEKSLCGAQQNNQNCFTAQGVGNNKELFFIFQKLLAQSGWNITYEHLNQIGIIKAKKASQKVCLIIRTHDIYKEQNILHYIIQ